MTEVEGPLARLAARAHEGHVVVVGGGVAGLVAALECAKVGLRVTVLESDDRVGGLLRSAELDGLRVDVGAESYATRGGAVRALVDDLGLAEAVTRPQPAGAWVAGLPGDAAAPLPRGGVLGIPGTPFDPAVRRIIGWRGAWRAYLDRVRPPLTIGREHSLGRLVRTRMGAAVLDRLVAPVTGGVYSARPDDIDVELAAPGLNGALTRTGSLSGAVIELSAERQATPGAAVEGLVGGMTGLIDALVARLGELDVEVRTGVAARGLRHGGDAPDAPRGADAPAPPATPGSPRDGGVWEVVAEADDESAVLRADAVIVACGEEAARALLAPAVPGLDAEAGPAPVVEVVTFVIDAPALDAAPRGSGVLTVPGSHAAKALTHATAKWGWLAERAGAGRHVVRVSFGAQGEEPATAALNETDAVALAVGEAAALLGVALDPARVRAGVRQRYVQSQPGAAIGRAAQTAAARTAIRAVPGLGAAGAWLAGTGLAQVVPDARAEADRVRAALLWGGEGRRDE